MVKPGSGWADAARDPVRSVSPFVAVAVAAALVFRIGVGTRAGGAAAGDGALVPTGVGVDVVVV
jgi:hypothetical protein